MTDLVELFAGFFKFLVVMAIVGGVLGGVALAGLAWVFLS
jgi:hypothetical protein